MRSGIRFWLRWVLKQCFLMVNVPLPFNLPPQEKKKQRKNNSLVHFWVCNILSCLLLIQSNQFLHEGVSCAPLIRSWTLITGSRCIQDYFFMGLSFHLSPYSLVDFVCYLAWLSFFKPPWWPVSTFCAQIALNFQRNY